jgi:hypothetical protein
MVLWGNVAKNELKNEQYFKRLAAKFPRQGSREFLLRRAGKLASHAGNLAARTRNFLVSARFEVRTSAPVENYCRERMPDPSTEAFALNAIVPQCVQGSLAIETDVEARPYLSIARSWRTRGAIVLAGSTKLAARAGAQLINRLEAGRGSFPIPYRACNTIAVSFLMRGPLPRSVFFSIGLFEGSLMAMRSRQPAE